MPPSVVAMAKISKIHTVGGASAPAPRSLSASCSADKARHGSQYIDGAIEMRDGRERLVIEIS
jgi:hypothetical protein